MSRMTSTLEAAVAGRSATSAAELAAPVYGSGTNAPFTRLRSAGASKRTLIKLAGAGGGSGSIAVTIWYCDPTSQTAWIADDVALAGSWTVAYAAADKNVAILVDNHGFDIGVSCVVSASSITATITATESEIG